MPVFYPDTDPVVIREHFYYDTGVESLVLTDNTEGFVPVETRGLGLFNYMFSGSQSIKNGDESVYDAREAEKSAILYKALIILFCMILFVKFSSVLKTSIQKIRGKSEFAVAKLLEIKPPSKQTFPNVTRFRKLRVPGSRRSSLAKTLHRAKAAPEYYYITATTSNKVRKVVASKESLYKLDTEQSLPLFNPSFNLSHFSFSPQHHVSENPFHYNYDTSAKCHTPESSISSTDSVFSPNRSGNTSDEQDSPVIETDPVYLKLAVQHRV